VASSGKNERITKIRGGPLWLRHHYQSINLF